MVLLNPEETLTLIDDLPSTQRFIYLDRENDPDARYGVLPDFHAALLRSRILMDPEKALSYYHTQSKYVQYSSLKPIVQLHYLKTNPSLFLKGLYDDRSKYDRCRRRGIVDNDTTKSIYTRIDLTNANHHLKEKTLITISSELVGIKQNHGYRHSLKTINRSPTIMPCKAMPFSEQKKR